MAWFKKERKPRTPVRERREVPADAWEKCDGCGHMDIRDKFERALNVCPECGKHRRMTAEEYIELLTDAGSWRELWDNLRSEDPLLFEHYPDRLAKAEAKAGTSDAIYTGTGRLDGLPYHLGVMNFAFMGGSMGSVVGEKIARLARRSLEKKLPLVLVCASGGARMQEGVFSLMQMAKTSAALAQLGLPRHPLRHHPHRSHHRRGVGVVRHAGRRDPGGAWRASSGLPDSGSSSRPSDRTCRRGSRRRSSCWITGRWTTWCRADRSGTPRRGCCGTCRAHGRGMRPPTRVE